MTTQQTAPVKLTTDQAEELAGDLIRQLAEHIGDPSAMDDIFRHWLDVLDAQRFLYVCAAALRTTFVDCLAVAGDDAAPDGATAFVAKEARA